MLSSYPSTSPASCHASPVHTPHDRFLALWCVKRVRCGWKHAQRNGKKSKDARVCVCTCLPASGCIVPRCLQHSADDCAHVPRQQVSLPILFTLKCSRSVDCGSSLSIYSWPYIVHPRPAQLGVQHHAGGAACIPIFSTGMHCCKQLLLSIACSDFCH